MEDDNGNADEKRVWGFKEVFVGICPGIRAGNIGAFAEKVVAEVGGGGLLRAGHRKVELDFFGYCDMRGRCEKRYEQLCWETFCEVMNSLQIKPP